MRVVVLGGSGHLGSRALKAAQGVDGLSVRAASRRGEVRVDLTDPSTFSGLEGVDVVVDLADTSTYAPDALAAWCLEHGQVFLEASSDLAVIERLKARFTGVTGPGAVVLGAGIYTGLSNLLGAEASLAVGGASRLTFAVNSSPFSGAGGGTVALMAAVLAQPGVSIRGGKLVRWDGMKPGPPVPYPSGACASLHVPFAEAPMLAASTGAQDIDVLLTPGGTVMVWAFRALPGWLLRARWFAWIFARYMNFLRGILLARRATTVELYVRAEGPRGVVERALVTNDGMTAGGAAVGGILDALAQRPRNFTGLQLIDQVVTLAEVLPATQRLLPAGVTLTVGRSERT